MKKIERIAPQNELDLSEYEVIDAGGKYVAPGLVDIHIHGYLGEDVSDGTTQGIKCLLPDGTIAGSVLRLNEAVYNLYSNTELPIEKAVAAASLNPVRAIGEGAEIGSLEVGKRADIIIADEKFTVVKTIIGGTVRYERG